MNYEADGVVVGRKKDCQFNQKYLTILTNKGLIDVKVKPFGQVNKNLYNNLDVLGYYHFNIYQGRGFESINSCEPKELFYDLRFNPKKLALAQYFCEIIKIVLPSNQNTKRHLRLLLNSLWKLNTFKEDERFIKSVFEFRILSYSGYMPNLMGCKECSKYESERMYYIPNSSSLLCEECLKKYPSSDAIYLPNTVLHALRFITFKDDKEIFNFKIPKKYLNFYYQMTEYCILNVLERSLVTLTIYKQFIAKETSDHNG